MCRPSVGKSESKEVTSILVQEKRGHFSSNIFNSHERNHIFFGQ